MLSFLWDHWGPILQWSKQLVLLLLLLTMEFVVDEVMMGPFWLRWYICRFANHHVSKDKENTQKVIIIQERCHMSLSHFLRYSSLLTTKLYLHFYGTELRLVPV